ESEAADIVIAHEPIWAIGTGGAATPDQAQEVHKMIRSVLAGHYSQECAAELQILYGGSMKPHNAEERMRRRDVDGGSMGGASVKASSFTDISNIAGEHSS